MILQVCPSMYLSVQIQLKATQKSLDKEIVQQWHKRLKNISAASTGTSTERYYPVALLRDWE